MQPSINNYLKNNLKTIDNSIYINTFQISSYSFQKNNKKDLKQLNNLYIQISAWLKIDKTIKNLQNQIKQLQKNLNELQINVHIKDNLLSNICQSILSTIKSTQQQIDLSPITMNIDIKKKK